MGTREVPDMTTDRPGGKPLQSSDLYISKAVNSALR
jgi:hypothetical protein